MKRQRKVPLNYLSGIFTLFFGIFVLTGVLYGQTALIGGNIYTGATDGVGPVYAPNPMTPGITNAKVMVQNQHSGGAIITYGTVVDSSWTATVPAPGDYVVMFSAPGHDLTSREFRVEDGDTLFNDAYLPPLYKNLDGTPSPNELPLANLLVFAFHDNMVNGEPDDYPEDIPMNGVKWTISDEEGYVLATGFTGSQDTIYLPDGNTIYPTDGLYYFTGLPPGEVIATSNPDSAYLFPQDSLLSFDASTEFYLNYTEEGGPAWDPKLYPGDPGTEAGNYLIWHSYVEKLGQIDASNVEERFGPGATLVDAGSVSGTLLDADGNDPEEPFPVPGPPGASINGPVPDGLVVLFTDGETMTTRPVATTEADPVTGDFSFINVPPGNYKIFAVDWPLDYVWVQMQFNLGPNQNLTALDALIPRFFARGWGYVYDKSTGLPMEGLDVHIRFKSGSIKLTQTTDSTGWYNFDDLPEIEVMGYVDVELPPDYRGATVTDTFTFNTWDPGTPIFEVVTHNAMNRYIQWYTLNYQADLYLEPIPPTEGDVRGWVWYDHLAKDTWVGDGIYDRGEERTLHGLRVELWDSTGTVLLDSTVTGSLDKDAVLAQGWKPPYTAPPADEWGGVYVGPMIGFYEFRSLAPGSYMVKVIPPTGYTAAIGNPTTVTVTVTGGLGTEHNFGLTTDAPLAGEIEGGVWDDFFIDPDSLSTMYMEKAAITGAPVGVYDHLGYLLGKMYQGNPLCYDGSPKCPLGEEPIQKPEAERRFAPGVHIYYGNDPAFCEDTNDNGILDPGEDTNGNGRLDCYNPNYLPLILPYTFGQGKYKFEADWSLVPVGFGGLGPANLDDFEIEADNRPIVGSTFPAGDPVVLAEGDVIRLYGQDFGDAPGWGTVSLAGQKQKIVHWQDDYIDVKIVPNAISGPLMVATSTGISEAANIEINYSPEQASFMAEHSVYVDLNNTGPKDGSKANPWPTLQEALDNLPATPPRYVYVAPGTYHERLHLTQGGIQLIGTGPHLTILDGIPEMGNEGSFVPGEGQGFDVGWGPVIHIGDGGPEDGEGPWPGSVRNIMITGFTITGGTVADDLGCGIFADFGNEDLNINNNLIYENGGYYGGGIWMHHSNHNVDIWSNTIAENGNYGGYGGGISVCDEPEYGEEHGQPEHIWDDYLPGPPPGTYNITNNLIFHNFSPDMGGGVSLYEIKDHLNIYGNIFAENFSEDHGAGIFFEDTGPIDIYGNVFLRNFNYDDGGAISFEDVADTTAHVKVYNNLIVENMSDDHGENHARGAGIAFDDVRDAKVFNNTIVGNIVAGSATPAGGGLDSERHGHEYNGTDGPYMAPGYSDPQIYNNIVWSNWNLLYEQPIGGEEEDLPYIFGKNYQWVLDELHVDNPDLQEEWESHLNTESFTYVQFNDIGDGSYASRVGNVALDPDFIDTANLNWHLNATSPVINKVLAKTAPGEDLDRSTRLSPEGGGAFGVGGFRYDYGNGKMLTGPGADMGAYEWQLIYANVMRIPTGILGAIQMPIPGSSSLGAGYQNGNDKE